MGSRAGSDRRRARFDLGRFDLGLVALGMAVPLGWVLHDLAVYATSGRPALMLELLPGSAAILAAGAVFGWAGRRPGFALGAVVVSGAVCVALRYAGPETSLTSTWFPRAVFLLTLGFAIARALGAGRPGRIRAGLLLGVLACAALVELRGLHFRVELPVFVGAVAVFLAGFLRSASLRRLATAGIVALVVVALCARAAPSLRPTRADLTPPEAPAPEGPNLLLVVLDTARADRLAPYGYERETTPELDRWVREHFTIYTSARSTSSWTLPSHASLFTGLLPAQHGLVFTDRKIAPPPPEDRQMLAERLRDAGYRTAGIVANGAYLRDYQFQLGRGFERYDDRAGGLVGGYIPLAQLAGSDPRPGHLTYRPAGPITDLALDWLDRPRDGRPFFLFLNYMDAHEPNIPDARLDRAFEDWRPPDRLRPPRERRGLLYDRDLLYMDEHLGRLLRGLEERGRFDDTVVVVTSDHGESLGDHGIPGHGWGLYESVVRVPLYVKPAGGRTVEVVRDDVTSADVFHLALDFLGRSAPREPGFPGLVAELHVHPSERSTVPRAGEHASGLLAWKDGSIKWIVSRGGEVEAYDLLVDPRELRPLALPPETAEAARRRAREWWAAHPTDPGEAIGRTEEDIEQLNALGYE